MSEAAGDAFAVYMVEHGVVVESPLLAPDLPQGNTWIQTLNSGWLDLVDPDSKHINLRNMIVVLARVPRFAGHTDKGVYSVAQHQVEGARAIIRDTGRLDAAKAFALHDGHEYAIGDMATPLVGAMVVIASQLGGDGSIIKRVVVELKRRLDVATYGAAGIPFPLPAEVAAIVKEYDLRMLRTERDARLGNPPAPWMDAVENAVPVEGCDLCPWSEDVARAMYLGMLREFNIYC